MSSCRTVSALLLAIAAPATAELKNPLAMTVDPADRAAMAEVMAVIGAPQPDLARLDAVLAKLPRPTAMRGIVQTARAAVLSSQNSNPAAVAAVEEALILLPDDPRPKLVATEIFTFTGASQRAADLWLAASREAPEMARQSNRYLMKALTGRLTELRDRARADRINARLAELGLGDGSAPDRSDAALARVRTAIRTGEIEVARQNVTAVVDPQDLLGLYVDRRYEALWPRIAEWASPTLADQSGRYLQQLHADWIAADDFDTATPYARRLAALEAHAAVVALFLPMFDRIKPGEFVEGIEFLGPIVARSLIQVGRIGDARALLVRVEAAMPPIDTGIGLNVVAARMLMDEGQLDWAGALKEADAFLVRANRLGPEINASATVSVRVVRACALTKLGRAAEAQGEIATVGLAEAAMPGSAMSLQLCLGDVAAARAIVIRRLADEETRGWALRFVQPGDVEHTAYGRMIAPMVDAVLAAPDVRAAAAKVGRILPQPLLVTMPPGFDPFRAPPRAQPLSRSAI